MTVRCACHLLMARRAVAPRRKFHVTAVHVGSLTINENQLKWEKTYFQDLTMATMKMASNSLGFVWNCVGVCVCATSGSFRHYLPTRLYSWQRFICLPWHAAFWIVTGSLTTVTKEPMVKQVLAGWRLGHSPDNIHLILYALV